MSPFNVRNGRNEEQNPLNKIFIGLKKNINNKYLKSIKKKGAEKTINKFKNPIIPAKNKQKLESKNFRIDAYITKTYFVKIKKNKFLA